jgi:hypothetical protein
LMKDGVCSISPYYKDNFRAWKALYINFISCIILFNPFFFSHYDAHVQSFIKRVSDNYFICLCISVVRDRVERHDEPHQIGILWQIKYF